MIVKNKPEFTDKQLDCLDCGIEFTFSSGEQAFFWSKGLADPKRCKSCRMLRKRSLVSIEEVENEHTTS